MLGRTLDSYLPRSRSLQIALLVAAASILLALIALNSVRAVAPANEHFQRVWARNDKPVLDGVFNRSWTWGPEGISNEISEPYTDSPGGTRQVQYFDKSRMEINDPTGDPASIWFVTNGLLVNELMSGQMQVGDNDFEDRFPADIPVAGDTNDPNGISYATLADFREVPPVAEGIVYTQRLHSDGSLTNEASLSSYNVSSAFLDEITNHRIAEPFWEFMNSSGPIYVEGQFVDGLLFANPFYGTGRPTTEFYWVTSVVGGTDRDVGIQCFERRCLTFTPGNSEGFVVEAGNVGLHYYIWRYETQLPTATPTATSTATSTATATQTATQTATVTTEPEVIDVTVIGLVDCDADGVAEGIAQAVGEPGACEEFVGGEIQTIVNGNPVSANEVQRLGPNNATGGTISLTFDHPGTIEDVIVTGIPYDATADEIETELLAGFTLVGFPGDTPVVNAISQDADAQLNEAAMRFTFSQGDLAGTNVPQMVADSSLLEGNPTTVGTFSTLTEGSPGEDEMQILTANSAVSGTFTLTFIHSTGGTLTTDPIVYNATAAQVETELSNTFGGGGVGEDAPSVSGGPANVADLVFVFDNGDLAGTNVPALLVDNAGLGSEVSVSEVEVLDEESDTLATWQIDSTGNASGPLAPGTYDFCLTYTEDTGQTDTVCTGLVEVTAENDTFSLTAVLNYGEEEPA